MFVKGGQVEGVDRIGAVGVEDDTILFGSVVKQIPMDHLVVLCFLDGCGRNDDKSRDVHDGWCCVVGVVGTESLLVFMVGVI